MAMLGLVAAIGGGYLWHRDSLIDQGRDECQAAQVEAENADLRLQASEIARLLGTVKGLQDDANTKTALLDEYRKRAADAERLRNIQKKSFDLALGGATPESLRANAKASDDNFERCRGIAERLGQEAVRGSVAAEALNGNLDQWEQTLKRLGAPPATKP